MISIINPQTSTRVCITNEIVANIAMSIVAFPWTVHKTLFTIRITYRCNKYNSS